MDEIHPVQVAMALSPVRSPKENPSLGVDGEIEPFPPVHVLLKGLRGIPIFLSSAGSTKQIVPSKLRLLGKYP